MTWWPFGKKEKKVTREIRMFPISMTGVLPCPKPDCICFTCPSRGKCCVEIEMRESGGCHIDLPMAPRIKECTIDKVRRGTLDAEKKTKLRAGSIIFTDSLTGSDIPKPE